MLETIVWWVGKPVTPNRWSVPYVPIGRPEPAGVQAIFSDAGTLSTELTEAVEEQPAEWPASRANWSSTTSVELGVTPLAGLIWADWPWALAQSDDTITVVHPLGIVQGRLDRVRQRLKVLDEYFNQKNRRDAARKRQLSLISSHLEHLTTETSVKGCLICDSSLP